MNTVNFPAGTPLPSANRIVRFKSVSSNGDESWVPALITNVLIAGRPDSPVDLVVFDMTSNQALYGVKGCYKGQNEHQWDWPEFIPNLKEDSEFLSLESVFLLIPKVETKVVRLGLNLNGDSE